MPTWPAPEPLNWYTDIIREGDRTLFRDSTQAQRDALQELRRQWEARDEFDRSWERRMGDPWSRSGARPFERQRRARKHREEEGWL